jgi:hypothetical protein
MVDDQIYHDLIMPMLFWIKWLRNGPLILQSQGLIAVQLWNDKVPFFKRAGLENGSIQNYLLWILVFLGQIMERWRSRFDNDLTKKTN